MSRKMQKPRLALYPKDIKEEREKVLSWYEVGRGKPPGEKVPKPGKPPKLILT